MAVKWENPPAESRGNSKYDHRGIADALRGRPGDWALVLEDVPSSTAANIRPGALAAYRPAGSFEARVSAVDQKTGRAAKIYARYVGEAKSE